ncbi:quinolinate synthase NadA [Bacillus sp. HMF5848]|uniref:quinolinate synthase NadA n=1 Tax=Bacillus sp. HMF5848 TaxID=2495421 RepID=UPI000F7970F1|nr:quinolinate synthase NadA [Bacillus sp. HMF5848]RSK25733.1 quinolinate synthase NadA [Bacillus sp. HMF5848]
MSVLDFMKQTSSIPDKYKTMTIPEMEERVRSIKEKMGSKLYIPCHHYQKDEVVQFADDTGDSLQLAQLARQNTDAQYIVFCGVHFMAETADILTSDDQVVMLPDLRAGCSMADMADLQQTERAWHTLQDVFGDTIVPLTYVNSTAAIKSFVGRHGGSCCTSSNAKKVLQWAFSQKERILFLPDQHLGRNTALDLGIPLEHMAVWDPIQNKLEYDGTVEDVRIILWKGHCSVHMNFTVQNIKDFRKKHPNASILVHPECTQEVVSQSDFAGSTNYIINMIEAAPAGSVWAIGTEMNLVSRLAQQHSDKTIYSLNPNMCPCLTMNRIDLPHLLWMLESIENDVILQQIVVASTVADEAQLALNRMLQLA